MMQTLVQRVEQLEIRPQRTNDFRSMPPPMPRSQFSQTRQVICYCCGQSGHFAWGCAQARPRNTTPVQQEAATVGNITHNAPHTSSLPEQNVPQIFNIINVSSYVLSCNIYNTPVSFLVDTGAGISLLNKEVWDKLRKAEDMLKPVVTQRIVGVDGILIIIERSVSVPVNIGKATFNHEFIVANEITAEYWGWIFGSQKVCA